MLYSLGKNYFNWRRISIVQYISEPKQMAGITQVIMACLIVISLTLNVGQMWTHHITVSGCTKHFEVSADYLFAVCANDNGVYVYKWDTEINNFVQAQVLSQDGNIYQLSMTSDGEFIAILMNTDTGPINIFRRQDDDTFMLKNTRVASPNIFHMTDNHLFLIYSTDSNRIRYAQWSDSVEKHVQQLTFLCNTCDGSVSEDGQTFITAQHGSNVIVYKKTASGKTLFKQTGDLNIKSGSLTANSISSQLIYLTFMTTNQQYCQMYKYNGNSLQSIFRMRLRVNSDVKGGDKTAISSNNRWFSYISFQYGYFLGKITDDDGLQRVSQTDWRQSLQDLPGVSDISFHIVSNLNKEQAIFIPIQFQQIKIQNYINNQYIFNSNTHCQVKCFFLNCYLLFRNIDSVQMAHTITSSAGTAIYLLNGIYCDYFRFSTGEKLVKDDIEICRCIPGYSWDGGSKACQQIDCTEDLFFCIQVEKFEIYLEHRLDCCCSPDCSCVGCQQSFPIIPLTAWCATQEPAPNAIP